MEYIAHSAKGTVREQNYANHVRNVTLSAEKNACEAAIFAAKDGNSLISAVRRAADAHDIGKLFAENQSVLSGREKRRKLPIPHYDAGSAILKATDTNAALAVYSHHIGLPNLSEEKIRQKNFFREESCLTRYGEVELREIEQIHRSLLPSPSTSDKTENKGKDSIFCRILLSCLSDADHTDTARHYGNYPKEDDFPSLRAKERLEALDKYIGQFKGEDERNRLRAEMYRACRNSEQTDSIVSCDSPVGSGKTTAVMAHLLAQAEKRKLRRIFVVLPFTNIIRQSVEVYRQALTLPGENPEEVVAELHHRADFEREDLRYLTALWKSPIIVTTAVAFYETLASNRPSTLRRLHELPGSAILVDEAHASLPIKLLPIAWYWMRVLAEEWGCYWVLASGSLVRYWTIEDLIEKKEQRNVPEIVSDSLRNKLAEYENHRITYQWIPSPLGLNDLITHIQKAEGPRLVIMNTIKKAAIVAKELLKHCRKEQVLHLSTSLTAEDREKTIDEVKRRLENEEMTDWTLVATSCVEAGVDFSFRTGFREMASVLSLLQTAGRVNRKGNQENATVWSFKMQDSSQMPARENEWIKLSSRILENYFKKSEPITPQLSTRSIQREAFSWFEEGKQNILKLEREQEFKAVAEQFKVIDEDTVLAVADTALISDIRKGTTNWKVIQRKSFQVRKSRIEQFHLSEIEASGIYEWNIGYSDFLGYMEGCLS